MASVTGLEKVMDIGAKPNRMNPGHAEPGSHRGPDPGSDFDAPVPADGYAWWYCDAISADGRFGLTVIAFVGSVFSPYYAWARRRGPADPTAHCAINVALYGPGVRRWAMTERGAAAVERAPGLFRVGPSTLEKQGEDLVIRLSERGMPIPRAIRGEIRLRPQSLADTSYLLNPHGQHIWRPLAPRCHVELAFREPGLRWQGTGYLDHNRGIMPLETGFLDWSWCRGDTATGSLVSYAGRHQDGSPFSLGLAFDNRGRAQRFSLPAHQALPTTFWRVPREAPADAGSLPELKETLEDTPFYSRSVIRTWLTGQPVTMMHESLRLTRFANPVVQAMLPFRMPRRG